MNFWIVGGITPTLLERAHKEGYWCLLGNTWVEPTGDGVVRQASACWLGLAYVYLPSSTISDAKINGNASNLSDLPTRGSSQRWTLKQAAGSVDTDAVIPLNHRRVFSTQPAT